jgi:prepilin-type N-terminal cleavage/methylation domain-containing protein
MPRVGASSLLESLAPTGRPETREIVVSHRLNQRYKMRGSGRAHAIHPASAFSMLELLVVIAIVLILTAIMLPVFRVSRKDGDPLLARYWH